MTILYHGTSDLEAILKVGAIKSQKAQLGDSESVARQKYASLVENISGAVRAYYERIGQTDMASDEELARTALTKINPLTLVGAKELYDMAKREELTRMLSDLSTFSEYIEKMFVFLGDDLDTSEVFTKYHPKKSVNAVLQIELPETILKRGLNSYTLVWWVVPINNNPNVLINIYAPKTETLNAKASCIRHGFDKVGVIELP